MIPRILGSQLSGENRWRGCPNDVANCDKIYPRSHGLLHVPKGEPPFSVSILGLMNNYSEPGKYPFFLPWFMLAVNNLFSIPWFIMTLSGHRGLPHFDTRSSVKHGTLEDLSKLSEILLGFTTNHRYFLCYWLVDESNIILGFLNTHGLVFSTCITKIFWIWEALIGGNENL